MTPMKKLIISLALVSLAASPAFAKNSRKRMTTAPCQQDQTYPANQAYACAPNGGYSAAVYVDGDYQDMDPDSFIRLQLSGDTPQHLQ